MRLVSYAFVDAVALEERENDFGEVVSRFFHTFVFHRHGCDVVGLSFSLLARMSGAT
jgi:hypothetical protein